MDTTWKHVSFNLCCFKKKKKKEEEEEAGVSNLSDSLSSLTLCEDWTGSRYSQVPSVSSALDTAFDQRGKVLLLLPRDGSHEEQVPPDRARTEGLVVARGTGTTLHWLFTPDPGCVPCNFWKSEIS